AAATSKIHRALSAPAGARAHVEMRWPVTRGHPCFHRLFPRGGSMAKILNLPVPGSAPHADEHARAETERRRQLFAWADGVLEQLGLKRTVDAARSIEELRRITFDVESAEVTLAIRDALYPADCNRRECFRGLKEGGLKRILRSRFIEMKRAREATLQRRHGKRPDWGKQLKLDEDGRIRPILFNPSLLFREGADWKGAIAFDEFAARVVIKGTTPLEGSVPGTPWNDHHETQTRAWFQSVDINPATGDVGRAVQAAARANTHHPVRDYFN